MDLNPKIETALGHKHKLLSPLGVNVLGLLGNWFWRVGSIACRSYYLEASLKSSSLERFSTLSKKKKEVMETCTCSCYNEIENGGVLMIYIFGITLRCGKRDG